MNLVFVEGIEFPGLLAFPQKLTMDVKYNAELMTWSLKH